MSDKLEWRRRERNDGDPVWCAELPPLSLTVTVACEWCWDWQVVSSCVDDIARGSLEVWDEERSEILEWDYDQVELAQARCELVARALLPALNVEESRKGGGRRCEPCGGPGPCLWADEGPNAQEYCCQACHPEPDDPFFKPREDKASRSPEGRST